MRTASLIATCSSPVVRFGRTLVLFALLLVSPSVLGAAVVISPSVIDFGVQPGSSFGNQPLTSELLAGFIGALGGTRDNIDVQVRNVGPGPLTIRSVSVVGASLNAQCDTFFGGTGSSFCQVVIRPHSCGNSGYFDGNISAILPVILQEGETCDLSVFYIIDGLGELHGTLTIDSDTPSSPDIVPIIALRRTYLFFGVPLTDHQRAVVTFGDFRDCGLTDATWLPPPGELNSPPLAGIPPGTVFPHGLFSFEARPCATGLTRSVQIEFPNPLPPDTKYWKFGPTPDNHSPHWYVIPATISGNMIQFNVADGGLGDDDLLANGIIVDQGGPGVTMSAAANVAPVPLLSLPAVLTLSMCIVGIAVFALRR